MDHFVRSNDELLHARRRGNLGYGLHGFHSGTKGDLLGLGPGAIGKLLPYHVQNEGELAHYLDALDRGRLPLKRGLRLSVEEQLRGAVIQALIGQLEVPFDAINAAYLVDFKQHFAAELARLQPFERVGAVDITDEWISVTPRGRLLLPAIAGVFAGADHTTQPQPALEAT
jgi:oxygen-independent coproporphyrinogen-3 oxidase